MDNVVNNKHWKKVVGIAALIIFAITVYAFVAKLWLLTAIPVGFLFGFFLQKGDLCGASAFSEVVLMKDYKKVFGLWLVIVVSMIGFAIIDLSGLVTLNPKPFLYLNYIIGGIIFGAGTVLAGGCISGCLFKAAAGNINSMAGIIAVPIGIALVEYGPLNGFHEFMKSHVIKADNGGSVTLPTITHLPFWVLSIILGIITLTLILKKKNTAKKDVKHTSSTRTLSERIFLRSWKPWQSGIAIGILAIFAYLSSASTGRNYPLGVTHGVLQAELLVIDNNFNHVWQKPKPSQTTNQSTQSREINKPVKQNPDGKKIVWWLVLLVITLFIGSYISAYLSGQAKLLPKPPEQTVTAFFGGILIGTGAAFATGCVIGNILSGWALMSVGLFVFGGFTILSNWAMTYIYLMGGTR